MKKIMLLAAVAISAMTFTACNNSGKADLKTNEDSLAYDLGVGQAQALKQYMSMQLGVDSAYIDEFIKGMKEGAVNEADPKKEAYMKGLEVGKQVQQMSKGLSKEVFADDSTKSINVNNMLAGLIAGLKGTDPRSSEEAYNSFNDRMKPIQEANMEKKFGENKKAGKKYLEENAKKEGVVTLESGVQYKVINEGAGAAPAADATVKCRYEGKLIDGTVFDSNLERDEPFEVNLAQPRVIEGWVEILKMMPAGAKWEVTIPCEKAYGDRDMGQIKPFSTLIFTIETLK